MDRSPATTAAYAAAWSGRNAEASDWPDDLPRPDLLLFLDLSETTRAARLACRSGLTEEEDRLATDSAFLRLVKDGYLHLGVEVIDAQQPVGPVVDAVLRRIEDA